MGGRPSLCLNTRLDRSWRDLLLLTELLSKDSESGTTIS